MEMLKHPVGGHLLAPSRAMGWDRTLPRVEELQHVPNPVTALRLLPPCRRDVSPIEANLAPMPPGNREILWLPCKAIVMATMTL